MTATRDPIGGRPIASRRIPDRLLAEYPHSTRTPAPHTAQEISTLVDLLGAAGASTIAIGHGRHTTSRATAIAVSEAWCGLGRTILDTVDWPAEAASWLKSARRLVSSHPDAWVIIDNPAGCAQLAIRLAEHENWTATRTFGTASLNSPDAAALTAAGVLNGMRGATATGEIWRVGHGFLSIRPAGSTTPNSAHWSSRSTSGPAAGTNTQLFAETASAVPGRANHRNPDPLLRLRRGILRER